MLVIPEHSNREENFRLLLGGFYVQTEPLLSLLLFSLDFPADRKLTPEERYARDKENAILEKMATHVEELKKVVSHGDGVYRGRPCEQFNRSNTNPNLFGTYISLLQNSLGKSR